MISSDERLALVARLQAHEDVAGVLRGREEAKLGAGAPRIRRPLPGVSAMTFSIARTWRSVSVKRAAGGREVVEDEAALVGGREEPGSDPVEQRHRQRRQQHRDHDRRTTGARPSRPSSRS